MAGNNAAKGISANIKGACITRWLMLFTFRRESMNGALKIVTHICVRQSMKSIPTRNFPFFFLQIHEHTNMWSHYSIRDTSRDKKVFVAAMTTSFVVFGGSEIAKRRRRNFHWREIGLSGRSKSVSHKRIQVMENWCFSLRESSFSWKSFDYWITLKTFQ